MLVNIHDESFEFIKSLVREMETQDRRATADPYFYVTYIPRWRPCHEDYQTGEETKVVYYYKDDHEVEFNNKEEALTYLLQNYNTREESEKYFDKEFTEVTLQKYYEEDNVFFTEKAFISHMARNGHNFPNKTTSYVKHAYRNHEMEQVMKALKEIAHGK